MELLLGFVLGVIASILATIFLNAIPMYRQRPILSLLRNPRLFIQIHRDSPQKRIKELIESLFQAWEEKDLNKYIKCWTNDAVRVIGPTNSVTEGLQEIEEGFRQSIARYRVIRVMAVIVENIDIRESTPNEAVAEVHYRFQLIRDADSLPIHEEATEFYVFRRVSENGWKIASNIDHSKDVSKS